MSHNYCASAHDAAFLLHGGVERVLYDAFQPYWPFCELNQVAVYGFAGGIMPVIQLPSAPEGLQSGERTRELARPSSDLATK